MDQDFVGFDRQVFEQCLQNCRLGRPLHTFEQLDSTNSTLWQLIEQGASIGTTVIAAQQAAGRGQWGRQWHSLPGGLYLSVALITPEDSVLKNQAILAEQASLLTLSSAWGLATLLQAWGIPVTLKWPNDLLVAGRKLGGILTETRLHRGQISAAIVGIGLNWRNPVPETGINLQTILAGLPHCPLDSLERLAAIALQGIGQGYKHWQTVGTEGLITYYLPLLQNLGEHVSVQGQKGRVIGVTATGDLRVILEGEAQVEGSPEIHCGPGSIQLRTSL